MVGTAENKKQFSKWSYRFHMLFQFTWNIYPMLIPSWTIRKATVGFKQKSTAKKIIENPQLLGKLNTIFLSNLWVTEEVKGIEVIFILCSAIP